jgi:hypothetical protein
MFLELNATGKWSPLLILYLSHSRQKKQIWTDGTRMCRTKPLKPSRVSSFLFAYFISNIT